MRHARRIGAACLFLIVLTACGCCVQKPAAKAFIDSVGADYLQYVEADTALTPAEKAIRRANVDDFAATVEAAQ